MNREDGEPFALGSQLLAVAFVQISTMFSNGGGSMSRWGMAAMALIGALMVLVGGAAKVADARTTLGSYTPRYTTVPDVGVAGRGGDVFLIGTSDATTVVSRDGATLALGPPPGCVGNPEPLLGRGVILDSCATSSGLFVYRVGGPGGWQAVPDAEMTQLCTQYAAGAMGACGPVAVGTKWMQFQATCYHCAVVNRLVSIATGAAITDPTGGRVIADLSASDPARRRCANVTADAQGSVQFVGDLALVTRATIDGGATSRIKRCHSTNTIGLPPGGVVGTRFGLTATNASLIVWPGPRGSLDGIQAHTDRRFRIKLPAAITREGVAELAISSTTLYVGDGVNDNLWTARLPAPLR